MAIFYRPSFHKDLAALKANHAINYKKICTILVELETGIAHMTIRDVFDRVLR